MSREEGFEVSLIKIFSSGNRLQAIYIKDRHKSELV